MGADEPADQPDHPDHVTFVLREAGPFVQAILAYDHDTTTQLHPEPPTGTADTEHAGDRRARASHYRQTAAVTADLAVVGDRGRLACTVRAFEHALELHFARPDGTGTIVQLDPDAAASLYAFIDAYRTHHDPD